MNWFTKKPFATLDTSEAEDLDLCEHLENDDSLSGTITYENDSFGRVGGVALCDSCFNKDLQEELEQLKTCHDCRNEFIEEDGCNFSFYEDGPNDPSIFVCTDCCESEEHQDRIAQNIEMYEQDFPEGDY